jgi:hypothetical protein
MEVSDVLVVGLRETVNCMSLGQLFPKVGVVSFVGLVLMAVL